VEPVVSEPIEALVKTPKLHFLDSGLLGALLGATAAGIAKELRTAAGDICFL
jgi:hypothetical protein